MSTLKTLLKRVTRNLRHLQEREAQYGGNPPLALTNQLADHRQALEILEEALRNQPTEADLPALRALLAALFLSDDVLQDLQNLQLPKPVLPFEPETVLVAAGSFLMGHLSGVDIPVYETPQHPVNLPPFQMGKYPVTIAQYAEFVRRTGRPAPPRAGWFGEKPPRDRLNHPVVAVSWFDALAYCRWLTAQTGRVYRLPTEAEWEKAARGPDGRPFPWGPTWKAARCRHAAAQTAPVNARPAGQSPYGCYDMLGNVWEWVSTLWGDNWQTPAFAYPYRPDDGRENLQADETFFRLFRGGAFDMPAADLRLGLRRWYAPAHADKRRGFRVVLDVDDVDGL